MTLAVIIAAYNASETIGRSVASALAEKEVSELVVVDDASTDETVSAALSAANGDPRLNVIRQTDNQGPSAARNRAWQECSSPLIAILDADDIILPDRFKLLLVQSDWDIIADNIVFCSDFNELPSLGLQKSGDQAVISRSIDFESFVSGNIPVKGRPRGELGFLKPVIRREFLERNSLRYEESCRLGEDFLLYAAALAHNAHFKIISNCGYAALLRPDSLSGGHGLADLRALHDYSSELIPTLDLEGSKRSVIEQHLASLQRRIDHRYVLKMRQDVSLFRGIASAAKRPQTIMDILNDRRQPHIPLKTPRLLLEPAWFVQD